MHREKLQWVVQVSGNFVEEKKHELVDQKIYNKNISSEYGNDELMVIRQSSETPHPSEGLLVFECSRESAVFFSK